MELLAGFLGHPGKRRRLGGGGEDAVGGHSFRRPFPKPAQQRLFRERDEKGAKGPTDLTAGTLSRFLPRQGAVQDGARFPESHQHAPRAEAAKAGGAGRVRATSLSLGGAIPPLPSNQPPAPASDSSGMARRTESCGPAIALLLKVRLGSA